MSCNCEKLKSLPTCLNELIIGQIALVSQNVYVFFKNISNDHVVRLIGVSDLNGDVTIDLTSLDNFFSPNYSYELWITELSAVPSARQDITFDTYTFYDCLSVEFFRIEDDSLESVYYTTITAELE